MGAGAGGPPHPLGLRSGRTPPPPLLQPWRPPSPQPRAWLPAAPGSPRRPPPAPVSVNSPSSISPAQPLSGSLVPAGNLILQSGIMRNLMYLITGRASSLFHPARRPLPPGLARLLREPFLPARPQRSVPPQAPSLMEGRCCVCWGPVQRPPDHCL